MRVFYNQLFIAFFILISHLSGMAQVVEWAEVYGSQLSSHQPGHPNAEMAHQVLTDNNGNVYVTGNYMVPSIYRGDSVFTQEGENFVAAVLSKMNPQGDVVWSRIAYSLPSTSFRMLKPASLAFDSDSNLIVTVSARSIYHFNGTNYTGTIYDNRASFLIYKISMDNSVHWQKVIRGPLLAHNSGDLIAGGLATGENGSIHLAVRHKQGTLLGNQSLLSGSSNRGNYSILKLDSAGNIVWKTPFQARTDFDMTAQVDNYFGVEGMTLDEDGNTYLAAYIDSGAFDTSIITPSFLGGSVYTHPNLTLFKLDQSGNYVWHKLISADGLVNAIAPIRTELEYFDGRLFLGGTAGGSQLGNFSLEDSVLRDSISGGYVLILDTAGSYLDLISTSGQNLVISEMQEVDSLIYIAGTVSNINISSVSGTTPLSVTSSTDQIQFSGSLTRGICFTVDKQTMQMRKRTTVYPTNSALIAPFRLRGLHVEANHDFFLVGVTASSIAVQNDTINSIQSSGDNSDAFIAKIKNCDYLAPYIEGALDTATVCQGSNAELIGGSSVSGVDFQWYYGTTALIGETDSVLYAGNIGSYRVRVSDSLCYMDSRAVYVESGSPEDVTFNLPNTEFCSDDSSIVLTQGSPSGGSYAGTGVTGSTFSPTSAGVGLHELQYIYDQGTGCIDTVSEFVTVSSADAVFFASFTTACVGDSITLTTGYPSGGTYSGPAVSGNLFTPGPADTGNLTLVYTISNGGCEDADSIEVYVAPTPNVTLNLGTDQTCEVVGPLELTGQSPTGGSFSGTAVTGNYFIPTIAGQGTYPITYSVTNGGCTGVATDTMTVDSFPTVVLPILDSICEGAPVFELAHGLPGGGNYSGSGIASNQFDASAVGTGSASVTYIFENSCAADTAYSSIQVISNPTLSEDITNVTCNGEEDGAITVSVNGGNFPYSFMWSNGDSLVSSSSLTAGTYAITASGEGGCSATGSFSVTEPALLSIVHDSLDDVVCNGFTDGAAYVSTSGGTTPYSFLWSNGSTSEDVSSLSAGSHSVIVTDANGCQDSLAISITQVSPVIVTSTETDVSCFGASDGSINLSVSGGGGVYSYAWNTGATSSGLSGLDSGTYILTVTDQNGCTASDTSSLSEPDSMMVTLNDTNPTCYNDSNGNITTLVIGGTSSYSYTWSTGATASAINALNAGAYTLTVTDANGCSVTSSETLMNPDSVDVAFNIADSIACFGETGTLVGTGLNGTGPYSYAWSNGTSIDTNAGIASGTYTLTVSDANGCSNAVSYSLMEPTALQLSIDSVVDPICNNDSNGIIVTSATGGTGLISYLWNTGSSASTLNNLDSGLYTVTVTDANGCVDTASVGLTDGDSIYAAFTVNDVSCFGDSSGQITSTVFNTAGGYNVVWSHGDTSTSIAGLASGSYSVTITDGNGCVAVDSVFVDQPLELTLQTLDVNPILCNGDSSGAIYAHAVGGGVGSHHYSWSTGDTLDSIQGLAVGIYALTVTSSNGCQIDTSISLTQPTPLQLQLDSMADPTCFGDQTGYIALSASGGLTPYAWAWNDADTSAVRNGLEAGTYSVTLTDSAGTSCALDTSFTLTTPSEIIVTLDSLDEVTCHGDSSGSIAISVSGGTAPYTYLWSNGHVQEDIESLVAGVYTVTISDSIACEANVSFEVEQPQLIQVINSVVPTFCSNEYTGQINLQVFGGTGPYTYVWSHGATNASTDSLGVGSYVVTISDSNQCAMVDSFVVGATNEAPNADLGADTGYCEGDFIVLEANEAGTWLWSTGSDDELIAVSHPGVYSLTISTATCSDADTIYVEEFVNPTLDLGNDTLICQAHLNDGLALVAPAGFSGYTWSTGGIDSVEVVTEFGNYQLEVVDSNGCTATDSIAVLSDTCLSVEGMHSSTWKIYPNPTMDVLTLSTSARFAGTMHVKVYNAAGQLVMVEEFTGRTMEIQVDGLDAGLYHIEVSTADLPSAWKARFIVQ